MEKHLKFDQEKPFMKIFLCETIHPAAYRLLEERGEIISSWERLGEADAVLSRAITVDAVMMDRMPRLRVIAVHGTGTDGIDLEAAKRRGIRVVYAPHMNANAVAELAVNLLLTVMRKTVYARKLIDTAEEKDKTAAMAFAQSELRGCELRGKTAGLVGFGAIGKRIAGILHYGFGMEVTAWSPSLTPEKAALSGCQAAKDPDEVFRKSDAVFLALPLNKNTAGLVNRDTLAGMKRGAVLVNTSRAGLVEEDALREALESGHLFGAASDVLREEFPPADYPLLKLDNFVATPHIGANTDEALYAVGMSCAKQILDVLEGREPEYPVV